tara:strand:+ start:1146 stop:1754 length:609 start_codon:yes stop_codon:yes gene_type:complete
MDLQQPKQRVSNPHPLNFERGWVLIGEVFKSITILIMFVLINFIATTMGSKTREIMSQKYWYNKQIVVFLTLYLVINIMSLKGLRLYPAYTLLISIVGWILFNLMTSLGEVWAIRSPPITWLWLTCIPLILFFISNDFYNYYSELEPNDHNKYYTNLWFNIIKILIVIIIFLIITGFIIALTSAKSKKGFNFINFFFSINNA